MKKLLLGICILALGAAAYAAPTITVYADGVTLEAGATVRSLPIFLAKISDPLNVKKSTISLKIDGAATSPTITPTSSEAASYEASYKVTAALAKASHYILVEASNTSDAPASTQITFTVLGEFRVTDTPKNYPNPFKPKAGQTTKIAYTLSDDVAVTLLLYDITGNIVKRFTCAAGEETSSGIGTGGRQGYNEVEWTGASEFGNTMGNGAYPYLILINGSVAASGQVAIYE